VSLMELMARIEENLAKLLYSYLITALIKIDDLIN